MPFSLDVKFLESLPDKTLTHRKDDIRELDENNQPFPLFSSTLVLLLWLCNHRGIH
jgi:hypothetical protein